MRSNGMKDKSLNVVFMGTPDFSIAPLRAIAQSSHRVVAVYTQPPRPKGRGQKDAKSPVHHCAGDLGIPVFHPRSLKKDPQARAEFAALKADVAVVAAYGLILPADVLAAPRFGCINIHASLLPRWRGASPIQRAIWAGDAQSGVTIMQMEEGLDTGPIILRAGVMLDDSTTAAGLHDALSVMGAQIIVPVLDKLAENGVVEKTPQDDSLAVYAPMLGKEDGRIDWRAAALEIDRQIRALTPWPGCWTYNHAGRRIKILAARVLESTSSGGGAMAASGTVVDRDGTVACGAGFLRLLAVQPENGRPMDFSAAINGGHLKVGTVLSCNAGN